MRIVYLIIGFLFICLLITCEKSLPPVSDGQKFDSNYPYYSDSLPSFFHIDSIVITKSLLTTTLGELPDVYFCIGLDTCEDCVNTQDQILNNLQNDDLPVTIIPSTQIIFDASDLDAQLNIEAADKDAVTGICVTEYGANESLGILSFPLSDLKKLDANGINAVTSKYKIVYTVYFHFD